MYLRPGARSASQCIGQRSLFGRPDPAPQTLGAKAVLHQPTANRDGKKKPAAGGNIRGGLLHVACGGKFHESDQPCISTVSITWMTPFDCITFLMVILAVSPLASHTHRAPSFDSKVSSSPLTVLRACRRAGSATTRAFC